jgi:15-cis-phytoene synthase
MSIAACAALVERGDPERFAAVMAAPVALRGRLFPLYAFNLEVARAPWVTKEAMIAEMRLQWWRDVVGEAIARAHEVAGPLHQVIVEAALPVEVLDKMVAARRWDIYADPFEDTVHFEAYLEETAGGLMWLACKACGAPDQAEAAARGYGWAAGLANYLRAVPELEARGKIPLLDGREVGLKALAEVGLARLEVARRGRGQAGPALLAAASAGAILRQVREEPGRVAAGALGLSEFSKRGLLAWKALSGLY